MSLIVHIVFKTSTTEQPRSYPRVQEPYNELFGFEAWRKEVWGHDVVKELGCKLIYSLREADVYAYDEELILLQKEFEILLENAALVSERTGANDESLSFRLENGLAAVALALECGDDAGVSIG